MLPNKLLRVSRSNTNKPNMAAVVVYVVRENAPIFFIGKESVFLRDVVGREATASLESHTFPQKVSLDVMKRHFTAIAQKQSELLGMRVQYDTPHPDTATLVARAHLRVLSKTKVRYGIVKGGMEPVDATNPRKTALREFNEECMNVPVRLDSFHQARTHKSTSENPLKGRELYFLNITDMLPLIDTAKRGRQADHYGELFDTELKSYEDLCAMRNRLNLASRYAIDVFMRESSKAPTCLVNKPSAQAGALLRRKSHRRTLTRDPTNE